MLTPNILLRIINDAQIASGIDYLEFARRSGIAAARWRDLRSGHSKLTLDDLPKLAKAAGLSFQVVASHHDPFIQLTEDEAKALLALAEHYKRNGPKQPHPLRAAVEKLTGK